VKAAGSRGRLEGMRSLIIKMKVRGWRI